MIFIVYPPKQKVLKTFTNFLYSLLQLFSAEIDTQVRLPIRDTHCCHKGWLHTRDASHTQTWRAASASDAWHIGHIGHMGVDGTEIRVGWVVAAQIHFSHSPPILYILLLLRLVSVLHLLYFCLAGLHIFHAFFSFEQICQACRIYISFRWGFFNSLSVFLMYVWFTNQQFTSFYFQFPLFPSLWTVLIAHRLHAVGPRLWRLDGQCAWQSLFEKSHQPQ